MKRNEGKIDVRTITIAPGSTVNFLKELTPPLEITNGITAKMVLDTVLGPCEIASHPDHLQINLLSPEDVAALEIGLSGVENAAAE